MAGQDPADKIGKFMGVPYDWRRPSLACIKRRWWNPDDRRIFTPKSFGWGWDLNLREIAARLHLVSRG